MKKVTIIIIIALLIPVACFAQLDFDLNDLLFGNTENSSNIVLNDFYLIWSANTYTPYEYQGRNLASLGSKVTIEAITSISNGTNDDLKFSWFVEGVFQQSKSGYGKNEFFFYCAKPVGDSHNIKVQIFNEDRNVFQEKTIQIPVVQSEIIVYGLNNYTPINQKVDYFTDDEGLSFVVKPYFFSIEKLNDLTFEWTIGQKSISPTEYNANILSLNITGKESEESGISNLWISVKNKLNSKQNISKFIELEIY